VKGNPFAQLNDLDTMHHFLDGRSQVLPGHKKCVFNDVGGSQTQGGPPVTLVKQEKQRCSNFWESLFFKYLKGHKFQKGKGYFAN